MLCLLDYIMSHSGIHSHCVNLTHFWLLLLFLLFSRRVTPSTRSHSKLKSPSQQNIHSSHRKSHLKQKSITPTSMRRVKSVCPSLVLKTGSQLQKLNRVRTQGQIYFKQFWNQAFQVQILTKSTPTFCNICGVYIVLERN